ncbi:uncharacterized protein LOC119275934 isoform X2 [Triticum dicoccoides]|uniref:uncharacterized protein LOC119275934 isoform X2 n=1 Tax=Triticum dicoccoides TaxID=85692 RepID=UPI00188F9B39|nr:uncharacterized protein LOC119275934 isoform X2 [Triticum dicoccoides]XP_037412768.1 uncharacterized protein LOC119275934 isoform X2 [Triticum dicoccoides]XP_044348635.1 uncharacterized protein LOC123069763 isoform X2 [Triticum aestivum]XP_044348636.1 uncharacterized protein LOC123069763 isoform X2 [Triticum aestivum]
MGSLIICWSKSDNNRRRNAQQASLSSMASTDGHMRDHCFLLEKAWCLVGVCVVPTRLHQHFPSTPPEKEIISSRIQDDRDSLPLAVGAPSVSSQLLPSVLDATATKKVEGDPFTSMDSTKIIPAATA